MPEIEPPPVRPRGRPKSPPRDTALLGAAATLEAATESVLAGEPDAEIVDRLRLTPAKMQIAKENAAHVQSTRNDRNRRTPQELRLARELDGKTIERALFLAVQGDPFHKINKALAKKGLKRLSATQYRVLTNLPQVLAATEAHLLIGMEKGLGKKLARIEMLSDLALASAERAIAETKKEKPDAALLKVLLPEVREYTKEISIQVGERVESFSIDGMIKSMSDRQLLLLAQAGEGEIIEGDFGDEPALDAEEETPADA